VYSQLHPHLAKTRTPGRIQPRPGIGPSPPGRLRGHAASTLASAARRLDADRARRVVGEASR
jgi:hypothetical protein